jgi:tetratricopeptide (TPR) repeat protein
MVDPVTLDFIGWVCGKLADSVLKHLTGDKKLSKELDKVIAHWAKSLSKDHYIKPQALFPGFDPSATIKERPEYCALQANLVRNEIPEQKMWHAVFMESWRWVRDNVEEPQPFFLLDVTEASKEMERLAEATYDVCVQNEPTFKKAVITKLDELDDKIDDISKKYLRKILIPAQKEVEGLWPGVSLPLDGPKVSEPFAGREKELEELGEAMGKGKGVVTVVGMAGQGKSCLAGEWYKRGTRPPERVGLFWRKVYEAGYTFERFLDEFYMYLTGEDIDRQRFNSIEARATLVDSVFRNKPCWVVLDGVERWLKCWAAEPDAGVENLTIDDRAGQEEILDSFLKGVSWWENGSRLLLTTRAVPSALDENPPVMIGKECEKERRLEDFRPEEAMELLEELGVKGDKRIMREAAGAYGNHPYAVHVLGILIHDLYGGDVSKWEEVSPLDEKKKGMDVGVLFEKIIEHRKENLGLLWLVACSAGPAPVEMLTKLLGQEETSIRRRLSELARWQMVEFKGTEAEQHSLVRKFLAERIGEEGTKAMRLQIAHWWAEREVPARPIKIEEIRPLLKAVEHSIAAGEPNAAMGILCTRWSEDSYCILNEWLDLFGFLEDSIRINGAIIRGYVNLIEKENRRELRNALATCYNNRGNAYRVQGKLSEAIADYSKAIEIYKELVEKENCRELRDYLAMFYNNRGIAYSSQGEISEAVADHSKAIEIIEELVEKENRRELRRNLAINLFNRALDYREEKKWKNARADVEKVAGLVRRLIEEGQRHMVESFLQMAGFRCAFVKDLGQTSEAAEWANEGMRWFMEEVEGKRENEVLLQEAAGFAQNVMGNSELLLKNGLDEKLLEKFSQILTEKLDNLKVSSD